MDTTYIDPPHQTLMSNLNSPAELDNYHQEYLFATQNVVTTMSSISPTQVYSTSPNHRQQPQQYQQQFSLNTNNTSNDPFLHWDMQQQHASNIPVSTTTISSSGVVRSNNSASAVELTENSQHSVIPTHQQPVIQMQLPRSTQTDSPSRPQPSMQPLQLIRWAQRPKFATSFWEEEGTLCYQVDANSICVARRQDNDMINGTKLLNVTGMSRGKRDGILKNEKARVVVKVSPMHLKGVWITFNRAKELSNQFKISESLYPLFLDDPSVYFQNNQNQAPSVHFMPPNQTEAPKQPLQQQQTHEFQRYEFNNLASFQTNSFSQTTPILSHLTQQKQRKQDMASTSSSSTATTPMTNLASPYFPACTTTAESRKQSPVVTHHVYPSYDSSNNNSTSTLFDMNQNNYSTNGGCLMGFSPMFTVPPSTPGTPMINTQFSSFQAAATAQDNARFNPESMVFSTTMHQQPSYQQMTYGGGVPSTYVYNHTNTPSVSSNSSAPPTPTEATFHIENPSITYHHHQHHHQQRNHSSLNTTSDNSFVPVLSYSEHPHQQQQQRDGFPLYEF